MRTLRVGAALGAGLLAASCGGNYDDSCYFCGPGTTGYRGTVAGLSAGTSVVLQDNLGATTTASNGAFTLQTAAGPGFAALLGVLVQPPGQNCVVSNGAVDAAGVMAVAVACAPSAGSGPSLADLAGMIYQGGADATGTAASFSSPNQIATDAAGNVYVADTGNHTIRVVSPAGVTTTLAGLAGSAGSTDGTGAAARFCSPNGVAVDPTSGVVYVADTGNNTIRKIVGGVVTTFAGTAGPGGSSDGQGASALFAEPAALAVDGSGNVYVTDYLNHTVRKITPGALVSTLAGTAGRPGTTDGAGPAARFYAPQGITVDGAGNVTVADSGNSTVRRITPAGLVSTLAGTAGVWGSVDGTGAAAQFAEPIAVAADAAGDIYVADRHNYTIRKITPAGVVSTVIGSPASPVFNAGPLPASLEAPLGVALSGTTLVLTNNNGIAAVNNVP